MSGGRWSSPIGLSLVRIRWGYKACRHCQRPGDAAERCQKLPQRVPAVRLRTANDKVPRRVTNERVAGRSLVPVRSAPGAAGRASVARARGRGDLQKSLARQKLEGCRRRDERGINEIAP